MKRCGRVFFAVKMTKNYGTYACKSYAKVAKLVDALDLGSSGATLESSSLFFRTFCLIIRLKSLKAANVAQSTIISFRDARRFVHTKRVKQKRFTCKLR